MNLRTVLQTFGGFVASNPPEQVCIAQPEPAKLEPASASGSSSFSFEQLQSLMEWKQKGVLSGPEFKNAKHQLGL